MKPPFTLLIAIAITLFSCTGDKKSETSTEENATNQTESATVDKGYPSQVYFGDTHLHTALSMDAGAFGNRLGMDEAYQFARGD